MAFTTRETTRAAANGRLVVKLVECDFRAGFRVLRDLMPATVGECLQDERHNPENGDGLQATTKGLLVWRKADNWTAFTDGSHTWVNGPLGLQRRGNSERFPWETTVSQPAPTHAEPLVQKAVADAARRAQVEPEVVRVVSVEAREWSDTSLGCPKPGYGYAQVITPGFLIAVEAGNQRFEYHSDAKQHIELC